MAAKAVHYLAWIWLVRGILGDFFRNVLTFDQQFISRVTCCDAISENVYLVTRVESCYLDADLVYMDVTTYKICCYYESLPIKSVFVIREYFVLHLPLPSHILSCYFKLSAPWLVCCGVWFYLCFMFSWASLKHAKLTCLPFETFKIIFQNERFKLWKT